MSGVTLDAGALIAFERGTRLMVTIVARALEQRDTLAVPAAVVAQTWRDGAKQVRLQRLLASGIVEIVPLDDVTARKVGVLCAVTGASDVTDASVVLCARERGHAVLTSDARDLASIDPSIDLIRV